MQWPKIIIKILIGDFHLNHNLNFDYRQSNPVPDIPKNLDSRTTITIENENFEIAADDLEVQCILGRGAYGVVEKVKHKPTGTILAVKRITATTNR